MAKKIISIVLVSLVLLSLMVVNASAVFIFNDGVITPSVSFTVSNVNNKFIMLANMNTGTGGIQLTSYHTTIDTNNYGNMALISADSTKLTFGLFVYMDSSSTITVFDSYGVDIIASYDLSDLQSSAYGSYGITIFMQSGLVVSISSTNSSAGSQTPIYFVFNDVGTDPDDPDDPDNPDLPDNPDVPIYPDGWLYIWGDGVLDDSSCSIAISNGNSNIIYTNGYKSMDDYELGFDTGNNLPMYNSQYGYYYRITVKCYSIPYLYWTDESLTTHRVYGDSSIVVNAFFYGLNDLSITVPTSENTSTLYTYVFNLYIDNTSVDDTNGSYIQGWLDGYEQGYDNGYNDGYNEGVLNSTPEESLLLMILQPVDALMHFEIAVIDGVSITIGNIFYTIIGIMLLVIFLKMFAGG